MKPPWISERDYDEINNLSYDDGKALRSLTSLNEVIRATAAPED